MDTIKPFRKTEHRIITLTIDENGDTIFLASPENDDFLEMGSVITKRASHVEPYDWGYRMVFHILRWFGDKTQIAEWTRHWPVIWRVNTKPVGGPILAWQDVYGKEAVAPPGMRYCGWLNRQEAIDAEIKFLNVWFLERGIS